MTVLDMPCRDVAARATEYLDGALTLSDQASLEAHLVLCPGCRHFIDQVRLTIRFLGLLPRFDPPLDQPGTRPRDRES